MEQVEQPCSITGPAFAVVPGRWQINLAHKSELHSPDSSYSGVVQLECLDSAGKVVDRVVLADVFGKHDWERVTQRIDIPKGVATARVQAQLNKTYGRFWIDEVGASYLAPSPRKDDRIDRVLFATAQLGNLLFPNDPRTVNVTVETRKPLRDSQHALSYVVRDYWGAEQTQPATVTLGKSEKKGDRFHYQTTINLSSAPLEVGRYYELHAAIPQESDEPFRNYTSLATLPEAETKRFKPEEVPFTSRNWDNRISEYIKLTDRLGVRVCGIWGGWSATAPYKAEAPNLELCQKLGMGWLTNTPIAQMELGKSEQTDESLRHGVRHLIEQYGKVRPMIINLGNEPHGTGERVLKNVAAYRVVYEEVKKIDPSIPVVAPLSVARFEILFVRFDRGGDDRNARIDLLHFLVDDAIRRDVLEDSFAGAVRLIAEVDDHWPHVAVLLDQVADALPQRWLEPTTQVRGPGLLQLGPEPIIGRQQIVLGSSALPGRSLRIATDGLRPFAVSAEQQ